MRVIYLPRSYLDPTSCERDLPTSALRVRVSARRKTASFRRFKVHHRYYSTLPDPAWQALHASSPKPPQCLTYKPCHPPGNTPLLSRQEPATLRQHPPAAIRRPCPNYRRPSPAHNNYPRMRRATDDRDGAAAVAPAATRARTGGYTCIIRSTKIAATLLARSVGVVGVNLGQRLLAVMRHFRS